ncbi:MAG: hypothetical protein H0W68_08065 [Gemmatimonadaceae bacterium]|nr:hypothetical protein [Gemmatimonadaceae bacterium]
MALDLTLTNSSSTAALELRQAQRMTGGRYVAAFLVVRAGAFAAALPLVCETVAVTRFVNALDALGPGDSSNAAVLLSHEGECSITFSPGSGSTLIVSGELRPQAGEEEQLLRFRFLTTRDDAEPVSSGLRRIAGE